MKLYGTVTSPFVRRVRVVCAELGVAYSLVNTLEPAGDATLRRLNPLWKVPTAEIDGCVLFDSHVIIDYLLAKHGPGALRLPEGQAHFEEVNLMNVIDGGLESAINLFYFKRDGVRLDGVAYAKKQHDRIASALAWLGNRLDQGWFSATHRLGLSEIALVTALDWMTFREAYPVGEHAQLEQFRKAHATHPSLAATAPNLGAG